jgi:hypothetical protein
MDESTSEWWSISNLPQPKAAIEAGDFQSALNGFAVREMLDYRLHGRFHSDDWICGFGVALWLMGDKFGAASVWSKATGESLQGKFKYSSTGTFQAGLLLRFASVWLRRDDYRDEANALFLRLLSKRQAVSGAAFPILLARLLLGEMETEEVRKVIRSEPSQVQEDYEWQLLFYSGVRACEQGKVDQPKELWMQAKERTDTSVVLEYYLLEHERKNFKP